MNLFHVMFSNINSIAIISTCVESACIFVTQYLAYNKSTNLNYYISDPVSPAHLTGKEAAHLTHTIAKNGPGFAIYDDQNGWKIVEVTKMPFQSQIGPDFRRDRIS